jgi:hypothetical protein
MVSSLRIPSSDVAGDTFSKSEATKDSQRSGEALFPILTFVLERIKGRRLGEGCFLSFQNLGHRFLLGL